MEIYVDGSNLIHKLWHVCENVTQVVNGMQRQLSAIEREYKPDFLRVALDAPGGTWRHELVPTYKAQRGKKPEGLQTLLNSAEQLLGHWCTASVAGHEADDIIATWCHRANLSGTQAVIVSADKDLYQLLRKDLHVILRSFRTNVGKVTQEDWFNHDAFATRWAMLPVQWPQYRALVGDKSDNMPGVNSIGERYAMTLMGRYLTIEDCVTAIRRFETTGMPQKQERALLAAWDSGEVQRNIRIHTLVKNVPLPTPEIATT
ncbi:5'-3' exonuclease H3TH domain-containing protein [Aureliella helgolandensis]|uniref:DNA polymerase I, thermostable n=1 Tax=Aureliella helgolandensis TaxID=2527968 RepID=A0A518GEC8_9BACT|nr:5'-3' exonuclease H3TH domain-containing protein [Aureliella helgolandensis]QDV26907.1 DNA polymerase I, thermostable [Aureliella helgolandensis]